MSSQVVEKSTVQRLIDWGKWSKDDGICRSLQGTLGRLKGSTVRSVSINDDEGELIDRMVAKLIRRNRLMGDAVKLYYKFNMNYRSVGYQLHTNKNKAQSLINSGVAWIDAALIFSQSDAA